MEELKTEGQLSWRDVYVKQLCLNDGCVLAGQCMRQVRLADAKTDFLSIVNPAVATGGEDCRFYVPDVMIRYGKGFIGILRQMPRPVEDCFRLAMMREYPRNKYFKMRKGEVLCNPDDQKIIHRILSDLNLSVDDPFDEWVEKKVWD